MPPVTSQSTSHPPRLVRGIACLLIGVVLTALSLQSVLENYVTAGQFLSRAAHESLLQKLGGQIELHPDGEVTATIDYLAIAIPTAVAAGLSWILGGWLIARRGGLSWKQALAAWGFSGWLWWVVPGLWEFARLTAFLSAATTLQGILLASALLWYALALAGWLATFAALLCTGGEAKTQNQSNLDTRAVTPAVWMFALVYVVIFTGMNWQLYFGLLLPHGDSAMYEEHLWNLTHGKGFRSYLDQGLFLGEHIQVVHLLLVPLHLIWPSQLLLELCESLALASGAIPVFWMARRHTGCAKSAALLALAYLLYFPLQFLDISIDLKTFRPISFGVPAFLFALDQLERGRYRTMLLLLLLALSAKEDFAIVTAPLGLWIALRQPRFVQARQTAAPSASSTTRLRLLGVGLALFATLYLLLVVTKILPWFRGGVEVHYVGYFSDFGNSAGEVIRNMLQNPGLLLGKLLTAKTLLYSLLILLPLGFVPLGAPGRLAVAGPLFILLCLNQLAQDPRHHFHAPLIAVVFWAASAGLKNVPALWNRLFSPRAQSDSTDAGRYVTIWFAQFAWMSALASGFFFSLSPLGRNFWDAGTEFHWRKLYVPGRRAEMFARIAELIPRDSRVASTDFVHPRFTHHDRSYDYSEYPRAVNDNKPGAPADTDFIVVDTSHRYSKRKTPAQIPEYRDHPHDWELLPDTTDGYFIVLKRKAE